MQQKLIALLILVILVGLPALGYWYFFIKNVSSVEIFLGEGTRARVQLKGSFSYGWLPLADRVLDFQKECETTCYFGSISPANYTMTISAENFSTWTESFTLNSGSKIIKNISLTKTTSLEKVALSVPLTDDEKILRTDDVRALFGDEFSVIDHDSRGRLLITKKENSLTSLGILRGENFVKFMDFPYGFSEIFFDYYNDVFILKTNAQAVLMTIDTQNILETMLPEGTFSAFFVENTWHAVTPEKTFFYKNNSWQENPRFTHFIDLNGTWRAGFIDSRDEKLMKLGNYQIEQGNVMILMNRKNGEIFELGRGFDLTRFVGFENQIYAQSGNDFYLIKIPE